MKGPLRQLGRRIQEGEEGGEAQGRDKRLEIKEIHGGPYGPGQVKDKMQGLVMVCPLHAPGRTRGAGGEIPMKIITADRGKENEPQKPARRGDAQQQIACLPDHQHRTDCYIKAAEYKEVGYFSEHAVPVPVNKIARSQGLSSQGLRI